MNDKDYGVALGTSRVVICAADKGIVLDEPSVIAVDTQTDKLIACGEDAYQMLGRAPDSISVIRPIANGVVADFDYACKMLRCFMQKVCAYKVVKPRVVVSVPASVTAVEQRSFLEVVYAAGARQAMLIEESMAAIVGAGLDIEAPRGCMVVEIGAGVTDVAVMSLKGLASSCCERVGGDNFDEAIIRYVRHHHHLTIGERTAEELKVKIGKVIETEPDLTAQAKGRDAITGLPRIQEVTSDEIMQAVQDPLHEITSTIMRVLENTPPELSADIYDNGIMLAGGMSQLRGMAALIERVTGIRCFVAEQPTYCVARGAVMALKYLDMLHSGVYDIGQFLYQSSETLTN